MWFHGQLRLSIDTTLRGTSPLRGFCVAREFTPSIPEGVVNLANSTSSTLLHRFSSFKEMNGPRFVDFTQLRYDFLPEDLMGNSI